MVVFGDDINLIESRDPLDLMAVKLDADDTDLTPAQAPTLGASAFYTWCWQASPFVPGRLDWNLYSDSTLKVVNAFVMDTTRLSNHSLAAYELEREDSRASDHLPLVVDVRKHGHRQPCDVSDLSVRSRTGSLAVR